jgi:hypothetical protein
MMMMMINSAQNATVVHVPVCVPSVRHVWYLGYFFLEIIFWLGQLINLLKIK